MSMYIFIYILRCLKARGIFCSWRNGLEWFIRKCTPKQAACTKTQPNNDTWLSHLRSLKPSSVNQLKRKHSTRQQVMFDHLHMTKPSNTCGNYSSQNRNCYDVVGVKSTDSRMIDLTFTISFISFSPTSSFS